MSYELVENIVIENITDVLIALGIVIFLIFAGCAAACMLAKLDGPSRDDKKEP